MEEVPFTSGCWWAITCNEVKEKVSAQVTEIMKENGP
jgi:hypothetical protein